MTGTDLSTLCVFIPKIPYNLGRQLLLSLSDEKTKVQ